MKNIKNILKLSFLLLLLVGCNDDEYEAPGSFVDLSLTFTSGASTTRESEVNRFFSFSDISAGAEYSEWRIPENTFFLEGPIPNNLDNHDEYIKEPIENVSTDKTVHVLFKKGDTLTKIGYFGIFPEETSFIFNSYWDSDLNTQVPDTVKTELINGKWVAEYEFTLDVYDTVVAKPEVRHMDGTVIDHINTESITITYGDSLIFEDLSNFVEDNNARPTETKWRPQTLEENEEDRTSFNIDAQLREGDYEKRIIDTIPFERLGEFRISLRATRERTQTLRVSQDTILMPIIFKVVPLDEDLVIDNDATWPVIERDDNRIFIPISSRLAAIEGNVAEDFTVEVDGTAIPVETVSIANRNQNGKLVGGYLILTLDVPLEPTDAGKTVTVSYSGTSITSRDERVLQPFSDVAIDVYVPTPMNQVGAVLESDNDEILVRFSQAISPESITNSADPAAGFAVTLNGAAFPIASMSVDGTDDQMLRIAMTGKLYQDDVVTIAFTGPGDIRSIGGGAIADFTAVTIEPYILNLLPEGDFESAFGDYWVEGASGAGATVELTTEQAFEGTQSAKLTALKPRLESGTTLNYEGGATYVVSFRRYILSSSVTLDDAFHQLNHGDKIWLDSGSGATATTPRWYGADYPSGTAPALDTWELVETEKLITADAFNKKIRIQPVPTGGTDYTVYYDDFKIYKKDVRP